MFLTFNSCHIYRRPLHTKEKISAQEPSGFNGVNEQVMNRKPLSGIGFFNFRSSVKPV